MNRQYGYTTGSFTPQGDDIAWPFTAYDGGKVLISFTGVETSRDVSGENVFIVGDETEFGNWARESIKF